MHIDFRPHEHRNSKISAFLKNSFFKRKLFFYSNALLCILFIYIVFISSIPENPLTPQKNVKDLTNILFPQGWNFFTRSPKESTFDIYKIDSAKRFYKINLENSCYAFGISRKGRFISIQLSSILSSNKQIKWSKFSGDLGNLQLMSLQEQILKNTTTKKYISNGNYLLVENIVLPWAWISKVKNYKNQFKVALVTLN